MTSESDEAGHSSKGKEVLSRLAGFVELDPSELEQLMALAGSSSRFQRGDIIRSEADHDLYLLVDGWAASAVILEDGSRQLVTPNLPGDILGLPALAVQEPLDTVIALTNVEVTSISKRQLGEIFSQSPRLAAIIFLISQEERSLLMERLALTGQASALVRLAALFVRLYERHAQLTNEPELAFAMPLTQRELGELIGVSSVHINGLLKQLRNDGVVSIKGHRLTILNWEHLTQIAGVAPWHRSEPSWLPRT